MKQFVPVADDYPVDRLEWPGPLVPYQCGVPCRHGLASEPLMDSGRTDQRGRNARFKTQNTSHGGARTKLRNAEAWFSGR